ncbi:MAG: nucleotidyltransferase [Actinomycetota bacterium]|nr:nucleotidyltransferase [Actinomycetota bacterium]
MLDHDVEFVIIGGVAALAHGVQRITRDIDLLIEPGRANCRRAIEALADLGAEEYLPQGKKWVRISPKADPAWLLAAPRLCDSRAGGVDICNAIKGTPSWKAARAGALEVQAFGLSFLVLGKDALIKSKLATGREQDRADVAELNQL